MENETYLADSHNVMLMVQNGRLISSSSRPGSGKVALVQRINEYHRYTNEVTGSRLAVCAIGYLHNLRAQYPDAKVLTKQTTACPCCGK